MTKTYRASNGDILTIDAMPHPYLVSAHAKLVREHSERVEEIEAMALQIAINDNLFAAKIELLKALGYSVTLNALDQRYWGCIGGESPVPSQKTEAAAWAKLIAYVEGAK